MTQRIWKFVIPQPNADGRAFVEMPAFAQPLSVGLQRDLVVWALVDPDAVPEEGMQSSGPRRFIVINTGSDVHIPDGARFLGTVTEANGIVWHVFDGDAETTA